MQIYDCIIAGGGPVGCYCSQKIAAQGFNVALYEEHLEIGKPLKCAGLVTPRVLKQVGISDDSVILNRIRGANIHGPHDQIFTVGGNRLHAFVIDRTLFDQQISAAARGEGAILKTNQKLTNVSRTSNNIICKAQESGSQYIVKGSLIIGSDGPHSTIRKMFQFPEPKLFLRGIGAEISQVALDASHVDIIVDREYAPGFFAWIIPINETGSKARIGLCTPEIYSYQLKKGFKKLSNHPLLKNGKIHHIIGGSIPLGPLKRTTQTRVMLVGDAAAHVKPTSGGGLFPGLLCAQYCSDIAIKALETQQFD
ncbi:MAG: NAD(P)/FAD-dependent oxidoreductase, partial [Candidatus Thermoplasmatota archaeon]|nr:NAD(P)/FAD-dependent oxidoreductase [Candidatus Thermoplasmatota archaeon]